MTAFTITVKSISGQPIYNAQVSGSVILPKCGFTWNPIAAAECSSGEDYTFNGYTDQNGNYPINIPYTVSGQQIEVDVAVNGYYSDAQTFDSKTYPGHVVNQSATMYLTPTVSQGSISTPPPGQGLPGTAVITGQISSAGESITSELNNLGIIAAVIVVAIAIILVVLAVLLGPRMGMTGVA